MRLFACVLWQTLLLKQSEGGAWIAELHIEMPHQEGICLPVRENRECRELLTWQLTTIVV